MMRARIVAGSLGGRFIQTPPGAKTHPMSERARSAIFNILGEEVAGASVLDAFAGSGSLGFEAVSRGAEQVIFVEKDRVAGKILEENRQLLMVESKTVVINTTVNNWLTTSEPPKFNLIFADPPYHNLQLSTASKLLGLLKVGGCMVLSHSGRGGTLDKTGIVVVDNRSYANACITFYRRIA